MSTMTVSCLHTLFSKIEKNIYYFKNIPFVYIQELNAVQSI